MTRPAQNARLRLIRTNHRENTSGTEGIEAPGDKYLRYPLKHRAVEYCQRREKPPFSLLIGGSSFHLRHVCRLRSDCDGMPRTSDNVHGFRRILRAGVRVGDAVGLRETFRTRKPDVDGGRGMLQESREIQ